MYIYLTRYTLVYFFIVFFMCSGQKSLIRYTICKYFLSFCMLSFHSLDKCLLMYTGFWFWWSQIVFLWSLVLLMSYLRNHCLIQDHKDLHLFSSKSFTVLALTFRSLTFIYGMWKRSSFILLQLNISCPSTTVLVSWNCLDILFSPDVYASQGNCIMVKSRDRGRVMPFFCKMEKGTGGKECRKEETAQKTGS